MEFLGTWLALACGCGVAVWLVPGIEAVGGATLAPVFCALALALVNATIKPIMSVLSLPLTIVTLGLFSLVLNALMLELASYLSRNVFHAGITISSFGAAFVGSIIISFVAMIVGGILGIE